MSEYQIGDDDLLIWSDLLQAIPNDPEEQLVPIPEDYLFRVERFSEIFWTISEEMIQLNDYCVLCLQQTDAHLHKLNDELAAYKSGAKRLSTDYGEFSNEMIMQLEESIPQWIDNNDFITRAMCLLLVSAFTERSLKKLCTEMSPKGSGSPKTKPSESKVDSYIRYLREVCMLDLDEPKELSQIRAKDRYLRNAFSHGDWDKIRLISKSIHLRDAFAATSHLLELIEEQAWKSRWGES